MDVVLIFNYGSEKISLVGFSNMFLFSYRKEDRHFSLNVTFMRMVCIFENVKQLVNPLQTTTSLSNPSFLYLAINVTLDVSPISMSEDKNFPLF